MNVRQIFEVRFKAKCATLHHDAGSVLDDAGQVLDCRHGLDLGNDHRTTRVRFESKLTKITARVDRDCDHVDADLDELIKGFPVEVSDWPVDGGAERDVHASAAAEGAARNDFGRNDLALHPLHRKRNRAANHNLVTDVTVVDKVCIIDRNLLGGALAGAGHQRHRVVN